ncbi:MMPL family transporter [Streptomyces sp. R28]|uniref:MMPL family transporter n=1 Tax=Streptomyces sp. R28 TaxID=3238628 RepID=A0AB39Q8M8_9ACTN
MAVPPQHPPQAAASGGGPPSSGGRDAPRRLRRGSWGMVVQRHAGKLLIGCLLAAVAAAVFGAQVSDRLSSGGYRYSHPDTQHAVDVLADDFHIAARANLILTVHDPQGMRTGAAASAGRALAQRVREHPGVTMAADPWSLPQATYLFTAEGRTALVVVQLAGDDRTASATARTIAGHAVATPGLAVDAGGSALVGDELIRGAQSGLERAELFAIPLTFLALALAFRSVPAALLPLTVGATAIALTLAVLRLLAAVTPVTVFALNITTSLGFGLAVDYSLFLLARYRSERMAGQPLTTALDTAVRTAGRTVVYSGMAVAASLVALLVFPVYALSSMAYAALSVITAAALSALVIIPAVIVLLGPRGDRLLLPRRPATGGDLWGRLARSVTSRPWLWALPLVTILCALAAPFAHVAFATADHRLLPETSPARQATQHAQDIFDSRQVDPIWLLMPHATTRDPALAAYTNTIRHTPGVAQATLLPSPPGSAASVVRVVPAHPSDSAQATDTLARLRALPAPAKVLYAGGTADRADTMNALAAKVPWAVGILIGATFVLLFLFTGSLLLPIKALIMAALGLTVSFGVLVVVFQQGHFDHLLGGFTAPGYLEPSLVIMIVCLCFGLATDYEMFLLSRIREEYLKTGDTRSATITGTRQTAGIITSPAVVLTTVLLSLAASPLLMLKIVGIGTAVSVLIDAFIIRPLLVPALLALLGQANWWAPAWMRRLHQHIGLDEHAHPPALPTPATPSAACTTARSTSNAAAKNPIP